jgi:Flp pilus assembly protein TadG
VHLIRRLNAIRKESGQILVLTAVSLPLMVLFVGFAIDFGIGYLTKAELAKACDAASLAVMLNIGQGQAKASAIGSSEFALNYNAASGLNAAPPSITFAYSTDSYGDPIVNISAVATVNTFFIRLAGFKTLSVANNAQATRPPVILSLVLDKSGSMKLNGGSTALPPAVDQFITNFIPGTDQLGEVSFSSIATPDVAMTKNFTTSPTSIPSFVNSMAFGGATFAQSGLQYADNQVTGVSNPALNAVPVVVFFTDGWANTNQDKLPSTGSLVNYGGCAPAELAVGWCGGIFYMNTTTGATITSTGVSSATTVVPYNGTNTFPATDTAPPDSLPAQAPLDIQNIAEEADYRTVQLANQMRTRGILVYSIGLGDKINAQYLEEVANDSSSPDFNPSAPQGMYVPAPTAADLNAAFQKIADNILLRLTQ